MVKPSKREKVGPNENNYVPINFAFILVFR